jgi:tRNA wybutosine-synthesizing protein 2
VSLEVANWLVAVGKVIVFEESNEWAAERIERLRRWDIKTDLRDLGDVLHVNCGFLPSSKGSWETAWKIVWKERSAWMHWHENVGVGDVGARRMEIEGIIAGWAGKADFPLNGAVEHVEFVKTFAPGVWHCVFDVLVRPASEDVCQF